MSCRIVFMGLYENVYFVTICLVTMSKLCDILCVGDGTLG